MIARLDTIWGADVNQSYMSRSFYFDLAKETYPFQAYLQTADATSLPLVETLTFDDPMQSD
jgi:hypothetical protein